VKESSSAQQFPGRKESRERRRAASQRAHIVYFAALVAFIIAAFLILQERG
jgi:hypothetical protein